MPKLSPDTRELRRAHILRGALRAFARTGFAATTIDDVAREAGVSKGAPYIYFPSKEALFRALYEWWDCGLGERVNSALANLSAEERRSPRHTLAAVLCAIGDQVMVEPDACRVLLEAQAQAHYLPGIAETVLASQTRSLASLEQLIRAGVAAGEWPANTDPKLQARLLLAGLYGLMDQWHLQPGSFSWQEAAAALAHQPMTPGDLATERSLVS
jgi:AcrR family transcriptional regulator